MVHGLTGGCDSTWTTKDEKTKEDVNWARDFIKRDIPTARIMTYGYSASYGAASKQTPFEYARNLLGELDDIRLRHDGSVCGYVLIASQTSLAADAISYSIKGH